MLEDIAILTGGRAIFEDLGINLESVDLKDLGSAKKITIDKDNTTIIEGGGSTDTIKGRIQQIKNEIDSTTSDYDREKLEERLAKSPRRLDWASWPAALLRSTSARRPLTRRIRQR